MSFRRITCIVAVCDVHGCGNTRDHDDDERHHDTKAEALEWALGDQAELPDTWYQRPDGQLMCWRRDRPHDWAREQDGKTGPGPDAMTVTYGDVEAQLWP